MHDVKSHVAGAADTEHRVEIRSVIVHQTAAVVNEFGNFRNAGFKDAERVGVRHHHAGDVISEERFECFHIDRSFRRAAHLHHLKTADGGRSGVCSVGRVGDDDFCAFGIAAVTVIGTNDHESGEFAVRSGVGVECETTHASDFGEGRLECVVEFQSPLHVGVVGVGMQFGEARERRQFLVDFGIIFHRATSEGIESRVDAEVVA